MRLAITRVSKYRTCFLIFSTFGNDESNNKRNVNYFVTDETSSEKNKQLFWYWPFWVLATPSRKELKNAYSEQ